MAGTCIVVATIDNLAIGVVVAAITVMVIFAGRVAPSSRSAP